jgi:death on curing protein
MWVEDILTIYGNQIARNSGDESILDPGLLEAALFRPQTWYYPALIDEAAAFWESLSQNRPFVDGNKRTTFAATYVFLAIYWLDITATDDKNQNFVSGLYNTSSAAFENLRLWLRGSTKEL